MDIALYGKTGVEGIFGKLYRKYVAARLKSAFSAIFSVPPARFPFFEVERTGIAPMPARFFFLFSPSVLDAILLSVADSVYQYSLAVMHDPVEDGRGQRRVVGEGFRPVFVDAVGGDHGRCLFVAFAEHLEDEFGTDPIDG